MSSVKGISREVYDSYRFFIRSSVAFAFGSFSEREETCPFKQLILKHRDKRKRTDENKVLNDIPNGYFMTNEK
jgi:hypothetical protein